MKCRYFRGRDECTHFNDPYDPGECLYKNGVLNDKAAVHCSIGSEYVEYQTALQTLRQAEQNFNLAAPEFVEVAALELKAAQKRIDAMMKEMKGGETMIKIVAFAGKVSELRKAMAEQMEKEKAPTVAAVGAEKIKY